MIIGKVVRILSDTEIVLDIGIEDEVKQGMEFVIFSEGEHIIDPETGEDLGPLETVKGRVEITHVMPNMSRAKTLTYQVKAPSLFEQITSRSILGTPYTETRRYKLEVTNQEVKSVNENQTVKEGDKIRSTL